MLRPTLSKGDSSVADSVFHCDLSGDFHVAMRDTSSARTSSARALGASRKAGVKLPRYSSSHPLDFCVVSGAYRSAEGVRSDGTSLTTPMTWKRCPSASMYCPMADLSPKN